MSHKPVKPIQSQISELIETRRKRLQLEISDFEKKQRDNETMYGCGGFYSRYQSCIEQREKEIEQLDALAKHYGGRIELRNKITRYRYRCANCGESFEVKNPIKTQYCDCPFCRHEVSALTESKVEVEVIVPPMPAYYDDADEWRRQYQ